MDNDSLVLLMCCLLISFSGLTSGNFTFVESPSDACVCSGNEVRFNCVVTTQVPLVNGTLIDTIVDQKWRINRTSSVDVEISSNNPPGGMEYSFVNDASEEAIGLIVLKADSTYHLANFTCIGFDSNQMSIPPLSTAAAILEVADLDDLSCSVSCPSLYSSGSSSCTVSWSRPPNASCDALFGYTVIITGNGLSMKSPLLDIDTITYTTGQLEAFQIYTASVTATSTCGNTQPVNITFMTSRELRPDQFDVSLLFTSFDIIDISLLTTPMQTAPRVAEYTVRVRDADGVVVLTRSPYPGNSTLLSLNIGSLTPCINYTVSVTASNTALETTSASVLLSLDPLTSLEVSCVAGVDGCYLEASCVPSQPGLVSGCTVNYTSSTESVSRNVTQLSTGSRVSCDNQTISYTGTAYGSMLRALGCPRTGMTMCPLTRDCSALNVNDGTVQYSAEPSASGDFTGGTVATYSCADGYELVGGENRTCLVDGNWRETEPQCTAPSSGLANWAVAFIVIIVIIIIVVVPLAVALVAFLLWRRVLRGKCKFSKAKRSRYILTVSSKAMVVSQDDLEMDDKADYEVVGPGKAQGQAKAQPPAPQKNPDGLVYADVGTFHERPRRIPPPPKEPEGVQYSAVMFLKEKSPEAVKPLPADDLLTLDNLLRQLSTVVHAWYIIGEHLGLASVLLEQIKEAGLAAPDAMVEVVDNWLRGHKGQPLWREVVAVLEQAGFTQLAADINRVYETNQLPVPPDDGRIELPVLEEDEAPPPPPRGQDVDECVEFAPIVPPKSLDLMQSLPPPKPIRRKEEPEPAPSWGASVTQSMPPARPPKPRPRH